MVETILIHTSQNSPFYDKSQNQSAKGFGPANRTKIWPPQSIWFIRAYGNQWRSSKHSPSIFFARDEIAFMLAIYVHYYICFFNFLHCWESQTTDCQKPIVYKVLAGMLSDAISFLNEKFLHGSKEFDLTFKFLPLDPFFQELYHRWRFLLE